ESREPVHRLDRRPPHRGRRGRGPPGGPPDGRGRIPFRGRPPLASAAGDAHRLDRPARDGAALDSGPPPLAAQRAPLRRPPVPQPEGAGGKARRGAGSNLAAQLQHAAAGSPARRRRPPPPPALEPDDARHPRHGERYAHLPPDLLPATEALSDVVHRMLPYWYDFIVPDLLSGRRPLIVAHGNSLRALVKHLDGLTEEEVI